MQACGEGHQIQTMQSAILPEGENILSMVRNRSYMRCSLGTSIQGSEGWYETRSPLARMLLCHWIGAITITMHYKLSDGIL